MPKSNGKSKMLQIPSGCSSRNTAGLPEMAVGHVIAGILGRDGTVPREAAAGSKERQTDKMDTPRDHAADLQRSWAGSQAGR